MKKILLLIEDYTERAFLNSLLKRVGWDVESAQSELGINDMLLSFAPQVVIATGFGSKIHGENLREKLNKLSLKSEIILILKKRGSTPQDLKKWGVTESFQSPIDIQKLFASLERLGGVSADKAFQKLAARTTTEEPQSSKDKWVQSAKKKPLTPESVQEEKLSKDKNIIENPLEALNIAKEKVYKYKFQDEPRLERYSKFIQENPLPPSQFNGIDPEFVKAQVEEFRQLEDDPEIIDIDDERKAFAQAMFQLAKELKK